MDNRSRALMMGAGSAEKIYVEDVFSTWLYKGTDGANTIVNGIDLSGKGGLVWIKNRTSVTSHILKDTQTGAANLLRSNTTDAATSDSTALGFDSNFSFTSTGFSQNNDRSALNYSLDNYASWTFRKAAKFFDIVTYTGDGTGGRTLSHALNGTIGAVIVKRTDSTGDWYVAARISSTQYTVGDSAAPLRLNATSGGGSGFDTAPYWSSATFKLSAFWNESTTVNVNGATYVAYVFAHDAGGFGDSGNDSVSACGSFTTDGSGNATITLGWEPQWLLVKANANATNWRLVDTMRGWRSNATNNAEIGISANSSNSEDGSLSTAYQLTSTGFNATGLDGSTPFIYIAIRRGPMKTPTDATKVFDTVARSVSSPNLFSTALSYVDLIIDQGRSGQPALAQTRLAGDGYLRTNATNAESATGVNPFDYNGKVYPTSWGGSGTSEINWMFRRAPGFFDAVCYTGTSSALAVNHNLGVAPELIISKSRSNSMLWYTWVTNKPGELGSVDDASAFYSTGASFTSVSSSAFNLPGGGYNTNLSTYVYVAYLFASCPGVSKVGSYTGTGTTLSVDCGFTNGARFVLIKRTDSTGDWYVWDTARGIVSGNDPYLLLNSTAAEVTNTDYIDPLSSGFQISSTAPAAINANGGSYIYLAIA